MTSGIFLFFFGVITIISSVYLPMSILAWIWVTIQSPHVLIGIVFPANVIIAISTVISAIFGKRSVASPFSPIIYTILIMLCHCTVTTILSVYYEQSWILWDRFWKTIVLVFIISMFMQTRTRIHAVVCTLVISLGLLAIKASLFTVITGGANRIFGPMGSQIGDNNHFGAALVMTFPFAVYIVSVTKHKLMRIGLACGAAGFPIAALFTYSRGTLLALIGVLGCYWLLSKYKVRIATTLLVLVVAAVPLMPDAWIARMSTIEESGSRETADGSVQGRFDSWEAHWEMAKRRPLVGGGFRTIEVYSIWETLSPAPIARAAHNSYFQAVGEHGFPGLILYTGLIGMGIYVALKLRRRTRYLPEYHWAYSLSTASAISMLSYSISSMTLSLATYDLFYVVLGLISTLNCLVNRTIRSTHNV